MFIVKNRKIFYTISAIMVLVSIAAIFAWGLRPGIDFTGGSLLNVSFEGDRPSTEEVNTILGASGFEESSIRPSEDGFILRLKEISQEEKDTIIQSLSVDGKYISVEKTFSNVGPILGKEAIQKSWISISLVLLLIVVFMAFAFRKVSHMNSSVSKVSSWTYGLVAISALFHDVIIPTGVFSALGHFYGLEVDTLFVTALLVILGFSVHDTIVVFDRVRENLHHNEEAKDKDKKDFATIVGESINQTLVRSINTSLTTLLAIFVLYLLGPETIKNFTLALLIGISIGTYSSIFIGSTLLVTINNWKTKGNS